MLRAMNFCDIHCTATSSAILSTPPPGQISLSAFKKQQAWHWGLAIYAGAPSIIHESWRRQDFEREIALNCRLNSWRGPYETLATSCIHAGTIMCAWLGSCPQVACFSPAAVSRFPPPLLRPASPIQPLHFLPMHRQLQATLGIKSAHEPACRVDRQQRQHETWLACP